MKTVFITGASKGIGKATKTIFEEHGYSVIAPSHSEMDLNDSDSVLAYCENLKDVQIDSIINNAGINEINKIENTSKTEVEKMFVVNLISPILLLNKLIPNLKKSEIGRIVNIGSIWAVVSKQGRGIYSATKNGIHGLTNALALELASSNILVNTVCPGFTLTELTKKNNSVSEIENLERQIPLNRLAQPEEIAKLIYFLGSDENTYITGQKITIDGGFTIQ